MTEKQGFMTALYERLSRDDELNGESNSCLLYTSFPAGKKPDLSLREKEQIIQKEVLNGVCSIDMTVMELVEMCIRDSRRPW